MLALFLDFFFSALEALLLAAREVGFFFVVFLAVAGLFLIDLDVLLVEVVGVIVGGATAVPDFFFFLSLPIPFFAAFDFFMLLLPIFSSRDWMWGRSSSVVLFTSSWMIFEGGLVGRALGFNDRSNACRCLVEQWFHHCLHNPSVLLVINDASMEDLQGCDDSAV